VLVRRSRGQEQSRKRPLRGHAFQAANLNNWLLLELPISRPQEVRPADSSSDLTQFVLQAIRRSVARPHNLRLYVQTVVMPVRRLPDLTPEQVVRLQDALLENANTLLSSALTILDEGHVALARSLEPSDPAENAAYLGTIKSWTRRNDRSKQRGFYVELGRTGEVLTPSDIADASALREVIARVHQIGWQLRLGEPLPNVTYRFNLPDADENPFRNVGKPGYEAETRELLRLAWEVERENPPE